MAGVNAARILRAPGSIVKDPTDLSAPYPFGGTVLGNVRGIYLIPFSDGVTTWAEEYAEPGDQLEPLRDWGLGFISRGWDPDVTETMFANTGVDSISHHRYLSLHGDVQPGESVYDSRKFTVLFVPENPIDAPAFIGYAAVPVVEAGAARNLSWSQEFDLPVILRLFRDDAGRIGFLRSLWDCSL